MRTRLGVCEDDAALRSVLTRALADEDYDVVVVSTGREAVERFTAEPMDAYILDIGLPDADGRDVCQALRAHGVAGPVLFLTARDAVTDRVSGFHAGGDDYLTKPFALAELLVRVGSLLRRTAPGIEDASPAREDELRMDVVAHSIRRGTTVVSLTPTEFRLLAVFVARPGQVVRRRQLVQAAWPDGAIVHDNTLDTYITRLRRKLREVGAVNALENVRGVGYALR